MKNQLVENIQYRRDILRVFVFFTFLGGLLFSVVNFLRELYILAGIELVFSIFSVFLWRIIPTTPNFAKWAMYYLIPCFLVLMYALSLPQSSEAIFVWVLTIPMLAYLLMGRQTGFWISVTFVLSGIVIYHLRFIDGNQDFILNSAISINILFSSFLAMCVAHVYELNREKNEHRLLTLAGTDKLTGLANRMKLEASFQQYALLSKRHNISFVLVLFDLDLFKSINDQYGHTTGDKALRYVAKFLTENIRESDLLARFGGEEFALLMTSSDITEAYEHIDLIRENLSTHAFISHKNHIKITLSAGVAAYGIDGDNLDSLMNKADKRLYIAKNNGRNCVVVAD
jgi:diguanylate cyclase (GGDEF)-like protein